jgi:Uncharacterized protein conserved in archaea (DUF2115).
MVKLLTFDKGKVTGTHSIADACRRLSSLLMRGDLGLAIADIVLTYSPNDLKQMKVNFSGKIDSLSPDYKKELEETIAVFLDGTYQNIRLMNQQGSFATIQEPVSDQAKEYWMMVADQCSTGDIPGNRLRF